jgi:hypothetical protein
MKFCHGPQPVFLIFFMILGIGVAVPLLSTQFDSIDPQKIYVVIDVTDSNGKTYRNLRRSGETNFIDYHRNSYKFNGNFTAITRKVSGEQLLKEVQQPEKSDDNRPNR